MLIFARLEPRLWMPTSTTTTASIAAPDATATIDKVMTACGSAGYWEDAVCLVREMAGKGVPPSFISYSVAISACAKAGQHEPALELLKEMKDAGINPNTITWVVILFAGLVLVLVLV